jgi:hypothetical protein
MEAFSLRCLWFAAATDNFTSFALWKLLIFAFLSRPCHGWPSWQFPQSSQAFYGHDERFRESLWWKVGGGKEIMMNGGPATANQVRDGEKRLKQKLVGRERAIKNI